MKLIDKYIEEVYESGVTSRRDIFSSVYKKLEENYGAKITSSLCNMDIHNTADIFKHIDAFLDYKKSGLNKEEYQIYLKIKDKGD